MIPQTVTTTQPSSVSQSQIEELSKKVQSLRARADFANGAYIAFLILTVLSTMFLSRWTGKANRAEDELMQAKDRKLASDLKEKDEQISKANERTAKLEKEAADARLELAKIDPVNLPIRSIRADIFLLVRGKFFEWHFEDNPMIKRGANVVRVSIIDKEGSLVDLEVEDGDFESFIAATLPDSSNFDGRTFKMACVWPAADWLKAMGGFKYWIDRTNASTAMLDRQMLGILISLPPTTDVPEKPVEIISSLCSITINGTIRRDFSVPKSAPFANIFCPVKKD